MDLNEKSKLTYDLVEAEKAAEQAINVFEKVEKEVGII